MCKTEIKSNHAGINKRSKNVRKLYTNKSDDLLLGLPGTEMLFVCTI
uniref:Uncharacterized protein n=1 Tax=Anguilla anguilla TaxID=7936 RepID=A0A0E9SD90_ANGAN